MDEKIIQEIIDRYRGDEYLSFVEIADDLKIEYRSLVEKLQPLANEIELKVFNRSGNRNGHAIDTSPFLLDYYYIVDCDLKILAETFGYSDYSNALRAMRKNKHYIGKNKNMFSELPHIPPFPKNTKTMRDRKKNRDKIKIND
jgi:hypothetical protein